MILLLRRTLKRVATVACLLTAGLSLLSPMALAAIPQSDANSDLYDSLSPSLFVVESLERVSRGKSSVGSAFAVADGTLLATNYHVVSSAFLHPDQYELRVIDRDGEGFAAEIALVDPVHDLALLRPLQKEVGLSLDAGLALATVEPAIGDAIFALGNPLDIGLSLVPGTYNGLVKQEYRPRIHFTGALNPGMSGGPAVNADGEVVGINVAGGANSIGILIPVEELAQLLSHDLQQVGNLDTQKASLGTYIREHQTELVDDLLDGDWTLQDFGPLRIPKQIREYLNCTGAANELDADSRWSQSVSNCTVNDRVFLSRRFDTGPLEILFGVYETDELSAMQFADLFAADFFLPANRGGDDDLSEYDCLERWTTLPRLGAQRFKASYCVRSYLDYPDVYDVLYVARAMPEARQALYIHYTLAGVGRDAAQRFHSKLTEALEWK